MVALRKLICYEECRELPSGYAVTLKRLSTNFACPTESLPSILLICPSLIMCTASTGFLQTEQGYAKELDEAAGRHPPW